MTSPTAPQLVTAAEAARLLGLSRGRVLELATSARDFPSEQPSTAAGRAWPRGAITAWGAAHPEVGPVFTGPDVPPLPGRPPRIEQVLDLASHQAFALNHGWVGPDHLMLAMLHPDCPGAARAVLESLGVRAEPLRWAFVDSMGDPYDAQPERGTVPPSTRLVLERANLEAARLADAEVGSEHALLVLTTLGDASFAVGWLARRGIDQGTVRRRVVEVTEGVALPEPTPHAEPTPHVEPTSQPDPAAALDLAPNPLGHDPRRRQPWGSMPFGVPEDRPPRVGMLARQYFIDRDGYPVLTTDGQPIHVVVDEHGVPVLDEQGRRRFGPVEVPPGAEVVTRVPA